MGIEKGNHKEPTTDERKPLAKCKSFSFWFGFFCFIAGAIVGLVWLHKVTSREEPVPKIELASLDFTVLNITDTRLSAKWDMSIRIPYDLPSVYIYVFKETFKLPSFTRMSLLLPLPHKSKQYKDLQYSEPQVLRISAGVSGEDIDGLIVKDITEDMKEKKKVRLGTRFYLTDCREKTTGTMRYACDDVTLRFEPGSEMKAALFGMNPRCVVRKEKP
ncbi:hypothetical protein HID58_027531 [Brassica napus]|uniref:Uncharacterized protein n=3 Tax=Brassica TaxID=3705 RepID=A0ABQ8CS55_BRANA|nr:uncharacterized protein LOC125576198 [Brassica napus]KAH0919871.1 hypothetical protein HID58_027531 [Brassica napus]CDY57849.1 BnaA07g38800D [Brassica napus]VDD01768.1 unnamed protein product [Brassica rapa]